MASREPVDAPEGTAARPMVPDSSSTSHSTVGLPRESRISRPTMSTIALIASFSRDSWDFFLRSHHRRVHAFDEDRVEILGRVLAVCACAAVVLAVVPGLGL